VYCCLASSFNGHHFDVLKMPVVTRTILTFSVILFRNVFAALPELSLLSPLFMMGVKWEEDITSDLQ
jgi:hypothetical protein